MHRIGIIHRDVKGANVYVFFFLWIRSSLPFRLLTARGEIKLADFGACAALHRRKGHDTFIGTRYDPAPLQIN